MVLLGLGPFWAHPVGPWLMEPTDTMINGDLLDVLVGYRAFLHSGWHLPLLFVSDLGPSGTNVLLLGAIPLVALAGKTLSIVAGSPVNPYGGWLAICFVLSAIFATLVVVELGQRSLLAACAASLLAISAPPLLHRFGHLTYMAHFIAIGALFLYLRDPRDKASWSRSLLDRVALSCLIPRCLSLHDVHRPSTGRRGCVACRLNVRRSCAPWPSPWLLLSRFLASPCLWARPGRGCFSLRFWIWIFLHEFGFAIWPQRSGLFPGFESIVDATGGQYEGFNYFGFGALVLILIAAIKNRSALGRKIIEHRYLCLALLGLFLFALSDHVYLGGNKLLDVPHTWRIDHYLGVFRSSGRMFWPVFYAIMLFGLVGVLSRLTPRSAVLIVAGCCVLQLVDTNPLRKRITRLTETPIPERIDRAEWEDRVSSRDRCAARPWARMSRRSGT